MSTSTKIEWCDHTFNPWEGCQHAGPGCDNCYAEARNARFGGGTAPNWGPSAPRRRTSAATWALPRRWNAQAEAFATQHGRRQRVFCASLADVFDNAVDPQWRADLFALIQQTPNLDWLLLTKRIGNVRAMLTELVHPHDPDLSLLDLMPLPNVWIGATIVNQAEADRDIPKLLAVPAYRRFLSMEPLLGPVDLSPEADKTYQFLSEWYGPNGFDETGSQPRQTRMRGHFPRIDWVIVGGESGPNARPMHPEWARSLRDQCDAARVPFLFKQWGAWWEVDSDARDDAGQHLQVGTHSAEGREMWDPTTDCLIAHDGQAYTPDTLPEGVPGRLMTRLGKKAAGRLLDGRTWDGAPTP